MVLNAVDGSMSRFDTPLGSAMACDCNDHLNEEERVRLGRILMPAT
ncbi:hypothetical protein D042_4948 [Vibrio parahaemolyticus NIHCB0757]|nr:hypothetical protein D042_4948 [Vibrio parahaemolyticus NIHCB0757]